jgi:hypothetical protein
MLSSIYALITGRCGELGVLVVDFQAEKGHCSNLTMILLSLQLFACLVASVAINGHEKYHYKRQLGASRSPCPAINTLANHGFMYTRLCPR